MEEMVDYMSLKPLPKKRYGVTVYLAVFQVAFIICFLYFQVTFNFEKKDEVQRLYSSKYAFNFYFFCFVNKKTSSIWFNQISINLSLIPYI